MLDSIKYWSNIWRKTGLCFQKWHEEFSQFSPKHVWKSKNWDLDGILLSKVENLWAQNFVWVLCHDMNNDTKFEEELTCQFKIDMRNLNFDPSTWKSQKFTQFRLLLTRVCNAWAKKSIEELCLMALNLMQNLKETGLCSLKFSFTGWKIVISFYKVKWQNLLKAELTDSLWKLQGYSLFSRVGIGWWTLL